MRSASVRLTCALCASLLSLVVPATSAATSTQAEIDTAIDKAVEYVRSRQEPSGEPFEFDHSRYSSEWIATSLAAAGVSAADVAAGGPSLQDFLFGEYVDSSGWWTGPPTDTVENYARAALSAYAAGLDPARLSADSNLPAQIVGSWNPEAGSFGEPNLEGTAMGILALAKAPLPGWSIAPAVSYLRQHQEADGSWAYLIRTPAEMTGTAIAALCEAGAPAYDPNVSPALTYLEGKLATATGAVEFGNAESTARAVSGLNACGVDPQAPRWTTASGKTPVDYLLSLQIPSGPEAGGFAFEPGEPAYLYETAEVLRALAGAAFGAAPAPRSDPSQPSVRPALAAPSGTPVPHALAIELAPGNVRMCKVTAAVGATLAKVLSAAEANSHPAGCVTSFSLAAGRVESIDGFSPDNADEAWLLRLDRAASAVAGEQTVGFGDVVSLRLGEIPSDDRGRAAAAGPRGASGPTGAPGPRGRRGQRGRPGHNARISCRRRRRRHGRRRVSCTVKQRLKYPAGTTNRWRHRP